MTRPQGALLVGSVNAPDAESTMRLAAETLGPLLKRIPDGEVGKRFHWIMFQPDVIAQADGIERVGDDPIPFPQDIDARPLRIADGVDAASIELPPLGYASAAIESYGVFTTLRDAGVISAGTRFQVSLPTPIAIISSFFFGDDRAAFEPVYEAALLRELAEITEAIPAEDLAIQWDVASELGIIEGASGYGRLMDAWWDDAFEGAADRLARLVDAVPTAVEVGVHLCYGDAGEKHFIEPTDAGTLVRFANATRERTNRSLTWLHAPVPISRDDDAYYAPFDALALDDGAEFYLGLVHREDGAEGAERRIAAAALHLSHFGVATECGCGRAPRDQTPGLLATHAEVADAW